MHVYPYNKHVHPHTHIHTYINSLSNPALSELHSPFHPLTGIHLDEAKRCRVVSLNEAILTLGQHFMNGSLQSRAIPKKKLPESIRQQ